MTTMTKLGRATRASTAMLAIIGVTAVMASVKTARAWDHQTSDFATNNEVSVRAAVFPGAHGSAFGSARGPAIVHSSTVMVPRTIDRQLDGRE